MACSKDVSGIEYEKECYTLKEVLAKGIFPIVARTHLAEEQLHGDDLFGIPENTELLIQRYFKAKYARIEVLDFHDHEEIKREKGCDFVVKHDSYVGTEFLLPVKYSGMFKFVQRPGSKGRYSIISEVLSDPPALLKVCSDTEALLVKDLDKSVTVHAGTLLEPKRRFRLGIDSKSFLECMAGSESYAFREDTKINFSTAENSTLHNLFELSRGHLLPKVIQFQCSNIEHMILRDEELSNALTAILEGPVEVKGFVDGEQLLCLTRGKESEKYETAIIPHKLWNAMNVQRRCFPDENSKNIYISKHFGECVDLDYVDKSLYIMYKNVCHVIWLQIPHFSNKLGDVGRPGEDDRMEADRNAGEAHVSKGHRRKSLRQVIKEKAQHVLHKLQKQDVKHFQGKEQKQEAAADDKNYEDIDDNDGQDRIYKNLYESKEEQIADKALENTRSDEASYLKRYTAFPAADNVEKGRHDQTEKDFFEYTVSELVDCLKACGMEKFATECFSKRLDGAFFQGFDLNELKSEPFHLDNLAVLKVRKIMEERSRQKIGNI